MKAYLAHLLLPPLGFTIRLSIRAVPLFVIFALKDEASLKEVLEFTGMGLAVIYFGALIWMLTAMLQGSKRAGS